MNLNDFSFRLTLLLFVEWTSSTTAGLLISHLHEIAAWVSFFLCNNTSKCSKTFKFGKTSERKYAARHFPQGAVGDTAPLQRHYSIYMKITSAIISGKWWTSISVMVITLKTIMNDKIQMSLKENIIQHTLRLNAKQWLTEFPFKQIWRHRFGIAVIKVFWQKIWI